MSNFAQKFKNMWNPPEDEFEYEEHSEATEAAQDTGAAESDSIHDSYRDIHSSSYEDTRSNVVNFSNNSDVRVVLFKPMDFQDVKVIADELVRTNTVVLNLEVTPKDVARRVLDFLSGAAYAKDGKVKRVSTNTYIIAPSNVSLAGDDMTDEAEEAYL